MLIDVLVACLNEVGLSLEVVVLRLVELGDGSFSVLVLRLHQRKGILRALHGLNGRFLFRLGIHGIVVHLLNIFIERLLGVVELQLLVLLVYTCQADVVARLETVEDGNAEVQADILREVVLQLFVEGIGLKAGSGIIV